MYIGIDVGGTNTDAVLIDEDLRVAASVKQHTTKDVYTGILAAVRTVLKESGVDRSQIGQAMLGTTQCTNAIVERKGLASIGILRIGAPASLGIPPMVDWAEDLKAIAVDTAMVGGGEPLPCYAVLLAAARAPRPSAAWLDPMIGALRRAAADSLLPPWAARRIAQGAVALAARLAETDETAGARLRGMIDGFGDSAAERLFAEEVAWRIG